jgi:hypothetical protein
MFIRFPPCNFFFCDARLRLLSGEPGRLHYPIAAKQIGINNCDLRGKVGKSVRRLYQCAHFVEANSPLVEVMRAIVPKPASRNEQALGPSYDPIDRYW